MKTKSKSLCAVLCAAFLILTEARALSQGTIVVHNTLSTGAGQTLATDTQTFNVDSLQSVGQLQFAFGFATEERPTASQFLDAATVTFQDSGRGVTLVCVTVDGNGVTWAPTSPGATFLDPNSIRLSLLPFNDQSRPWVFQAAYQVTVPLPNGLAGSTASLYLDLYDNGNALNSMAWVSAVPEPETLSLLLLAGGLWLGQRKARR